jgi:phage shock protein A
MPTPDEPLRYDTFAEFLPRFHREVVVPDLQKMAERTERRLVDQVERLWDALLDTRERLETEYQTIKAGLARVEHTLEGVRGSLDTIHARLDAIEKRLGG